MSDAGVSQVSWHLLSRPCPGVVSITSIALHIITTIPYGIWRTCKYIPAYESGQTTYEGIYTNLTYHRDHLTTRRQAFHSPCRFVHVCVDRCLFEFRPPTSRMSFQQVQHNYACKYRSITSLIYLFVCLRNIYLLIHPLPRSCANLLRYCYLVAAITITFITLLSLQAGVAYSH